MKKSVLGLSLLFSLGVLMTACGDDGDSTSGCTTGEVDCDGECITESDATLAWVQANVFDVHGCASSAACHNGQSVDPRAAFDLSDEQASFDSLVGVDSVEAAPTLLVAPNYSAASYLVNKFTGVGMAEGAIMPLGALEPLCDAKIDGVRAWIDAGANP